MIKTRAMNITNYMLNIFVLREFGVFSIGFLSRYQDNVKMKIN